MPKQKQGRIETLYENGGYAEVLRGVVEQLEVADSLPDWSAAAATARATAAILAVCTNEPARSGDVASWVLGSHLLRRPAGQKSVLSSMNISLAVGRRVMCNAAMRTSRDAIGCHFSPVPMQAAGRAKR